MAVDDLSTYEAMRDAGATPSEVYQAAKDHSMNNVQALVVLRKVFGLDLPEAYEVFKRAPVPQPRDLSEFWCVIAIDRRTRAPVLVTETVQPPEALRALMRRRPEIERADLVSWGNVTRAELEALIAADYLDLEPDELARHAPEEVMWSIFSEEP
jgi:hypothetical protein